MNARLIYMTAGNADEARRIGRTLVEENLVACVNLIEGMQSIYRWDGEICEEQEVVLIAKTTAERVDDLVERVKALHSYDCPCVVSLPIDGGNAAYLEWLSKSP